MFFSLQFCIKKEVDGGRDGAVTVHILYDVCEVEHVKKNLRESEKMLPTPLGAGGGGGGGWCALTAV